MISRNAHAFDKGEDAGGDDLIVPRADRLAEEHGVGGDSVPRDAGGISGARLWAA